PTALTIWMCVRLAAHDAARGAFPDAGLIVARDERIGVGVPAIPLADDCDAGRVRRPQAQRGRILAEQAPHHRVPRVVRPLAKQIDTLLTEGSHFLPVDRARCAASHDHPFLIWAY